LGQLKKPSINKVLLAPSLENFIPIQQNTQETGQISFMPLSASKQSMPCTVIIFIELIITECNYMKILYTEFHPDWARDMEIMGKN
jgi:hypothetical protein